MSTGIDRLRDVVAFFDPCSETFNQQFSVNGLLAIYHASRVHPDWHASPDMWTSEQIATALEHVRRDDDSHAGAWPCANCHARFETQAQLAEHQEIDEDIK